MTPRTKILFVAGGLITFNIVLATVLLLAPGPQADVAFETEQQPVAEGKVLSVAVPVYSFGTALDAMDMYASSTTFSYDGDEYPGLGIFVHTINGQKNTDDRFWILYVNGTTSPTGVGDTEVSPGDSIEWRFEESYF